MKLIKIILTTLFLSVVVFTNAQEVVNNGNTYQVKGEVIFMDGIDVTKTLTLEEKEQIKNAAKVKLKAKNHWKKKMKK